MTSQGGEPAVAADSSSMETSQPVGAGQSHGSVYSSLNLGPQSWASSTGELGISSSAYNYDPQRLTSMAGDAQGITPVANSSTSSNPVAATQPYSGYAPYSSSTIPYNYEATGYPNYHYGHQQSGNDSSAQQVGDQNSGAAYQPLSTFQNSGSYAPTSYFGTYYNTGDNQTDQPGPGYKSNDYNYQTSMWNNGNYQNYHHYYSSYTTSAATSVTQSSATTTTNSLYYQQEYNKWPYYYNQSTPSVNGVAGTEFSAVANLQSAGYSTGGLSVGYPYSSNQPPPPGTTSWKGETRPPGVPSVHEKEAAMPYNLNKTWEAVAPGIQTPAINQLPHAQNPLIQTPPTENHDNEQKILYPQASAPNLQHSTYNHGTQIFQPPQQTVPLTEPRQVSKMQIPTNPRITTNMGFSTSKSQKEASAVSVSTRPAYVSVTMPKPNDRSSSIEDSSRAMKGTFPPSLCAYVDRTFARCKDDAQRSDNQNIMKQIIAKATADGTLFTKNWDIEPLFPLSLEQSDKQSFISDSSLRTAKRSPSKRKSRWEPIPDEALGEKPTTADIHMPKNVSWGQVEAAKKAVENKSSENKLANGWGGLKFVPAQQQSIAQKFNPRLKKPRISDTLVATENTDHSSDSDKEQNLTKYHASALALADSPEEKRRRENRSKRFERGQGNQTDARNLRPKIASGGNTRRASALQNAKNFEDGFNKAVEDIDWDSLTVKGTCQEIEKRYLRLTSAPDPSTVRPEDVLEKALFMVQTSPKNYLYKCDQLKSIRQDLTVQRIQNALTVKVYETHARLSLEAGDLPEYNQCQSQLKRLYSEGIEGCYMEFSSYNLLSIILHSNNKRDLLSSMARLSVEAKRDEAVKHALAVHSAVSSGNYILFFRLYKSAPNLNSYFMDLYAEKMRFEALKCMCKACRPVVPVAYITRVLGFSKSIQDDILEMNIPGFEECEEWLRAHGAVLSVDNTGELQLDTKVSSSTVYMPEQEDAVAHGDANLAVDDFLTRAA